MDSNITTTVITTLSSTTLAPATVPSYVGFICLTVSILFFGSNYLPVKQFQTGDGMFFQLILTTAIWTVGFVVYAARGFPTFYALPMLGGFFWSTGNLNTVPIIKLIGIGMGTLFWNTVLLVVGWAIARFGLLGVKPEVPSNEVLNYVGVALAALSGLFYLFVKPESSVPEERQSLVSAPIAEITTENEVAVILSNNDNPPSDAFFDRLSIKTKRTVGVTMAIVSGFLYAFTFTPALYVQDNYNGASQNGLDYVFSLYTGIFVSSIFYFTLYCIFKKNKPQVFPKVILPALVSGWMWGIANSSFFLASTALTQAITFPIVSSGPSAISALWGIFLFKEIQGRQNFMILACGFTFAVVGSILCGVSK